MMIFIGACFFTMMAIFIGEKDNPDCIGEKYMERVNQTEAYTIGDDYNRCIKQIKKLKQFNGLLQGSGQGFQSQVFYCCEH